MDDVDIFVSFVMKVYGDRYLFDGEGGILVYVFYFYNNKGKEVFLIGLFEGNVCVKVLGVVGKFGIFEFLIGYYVKFMGL